MALAGLPWELAQMAGDNFDWGSPDDLQRMMLRVREQLLLRRSLLWKVGLALVALLVLATTVYQVEPDEVGVVTRFSRFVRTTNPGPHLRLPLGIESVRKVPVQRQLKQEFGFRTVRSGIGSEFRKDEKTSAEALMLTGDLNVATVEWIVQYKISDPYKYLFKLRDVEDTFRMMAEASMRQVVGDHSVTELLTVGREAIATRAKDLLSTMCKLYDNGITVQQLVLQDVDPPEAVKGSFNEVNQAIQERERAINEAWAEYNQEIPRARGSAEQILQGAEGYAVDRVNRAKGDAQRFLALHEEYRKAPEVTRTRLHLETMSEVLPKAGQKLVLDEQARGLLPLFSLGRPVEKTVEKTVVKP
jgi:modulator of FtsH protease HflK